MDIRPIKTRSDHKAALAEIEGLMSAKPNTPDGDRLDVLAPLVEAYEDRHFPIAPPDPIEAIKFRMEQVGLTRKDLEPMIGSRARVSEVLSGKRNLTLAMIRRLVAGLGIPPDVFVQRLPIWKLTPRKPKATTWRASIYNGGLIVRAESSRQRLTLAHLGEHLGQQLPQTKVRCQLCQRREAAVKRQSGTQQGRQLARETQKVASSHRCDAREQRYAEVEPSCRGAAAGALDRQRDVTLATQPGDHRRFGLGLHHTLHHASLGGACSVGERGHRGDSNTVA